MCLNPIIRPNTSRTLSDRVTRFYNGKPVTVLASSKLGNKIEANAKAYGKDTGAFIYVPCGHCSECVAVKQHSFVQRIQSEAEYNHLFFCTLTYDNKHLPILELEVPVVERDGETCVPAETSGSLFDNVSSSQLSPADAESFLANAGFGDDVSIRDTHYQTPKGNWLPKTPAGIESRPDEPDIRYDTVKLPFADIHHIQLLMKNLRDNNPVDGRCLRYVCVSELGKANGRPHFHILFLVEKRPDDYEWFNGIYRIKPSVSYNLESGLYRAVFKYWAINVGTRKNPVYEKLFTYRKRFFGNRVYTNFDLHYVDPSKTKAGVSSVIYYVTKYLMKGSKRDARRQQFLRLNLTESEYRVAWDTIKCRMTCSKGLGLDARMETIETEVPYKNPKCDACDYATYLRDIITLSDDLPGDTLDLPSPVVYKTVKRRLLIPNFDLATKLRKNLTRDVGTAPGPIFISPDGKHRPLSHYYQKKSYIYTTLAFLDIYLNYDDTNFTPHCYLPKEKKEELEAKHAKRLRAMECNSTFDTSPALLWAGNNRIDENNKFTCYGD